MAIIASTKSAKGYQEEGGLVQIAVRISKAEFDELKRFALKDKVSIASKIRYHIQIGNEVDRDMEDDT